MKSLREYVRASLGYVLLHVGGSAQVGLHCDGLDAVALQLLERRLRLGLGARRVVVDRDVAALLGERLGDEGAEVLRGVSVLCVVRSHRSGKLGSHNRYACSDPPFHHR